MCYPTSAASLKKCQAKRGCKPLDINEFGDIQNWVSHDYDTPSLVTFHSQARNAEEVATETTRKDTPTVSEQTAEKLRQQLDSMEVCSRFQMCQMCEVLYTFPCGDDCQHFDRFPLVYSYHG